MKMMAEIIKNNQQSSSKAHDWMKKWEELRQASDIKYHKSCEAT